MKNVAKFSVLSFFILVGSSAFSQEIKPLGVKKIEPVKERKTTPVKARKTLSIETEDKLSIPKKPQEKALKKENIQHEVK